MRRSLGRFKISGVLITICIGPLLNTYPESFGFGPGGFIIRGTFDKRMKLLQYNQVPRNEPEGVLAFGPHAIFIVPAGIPAPDLQRRVPSINSRHRSKAQSLEPCLSSRSHHIQAVRRVPGLLYRTFAVCLQLLRHFCGGFRVLADLESHGGGEMPWKSFAPHTGGASIFTNIVALYIFLCSQSMRYLKCTSK